MTAARVVVTVPWATRAGGSETMMWTWLRRVDRARLDVSVVFLDEGPFEAEVAALGLGTAVVATGRLRDPIRLRRAVAQIAGVLRGWQPQLLLNWSPKAHFYGSGAATWARLRPVMVWWQHDLPRRHWMDVSATMLPARAIGCSSEASQAAQRRLHPRRETFVVHPGIELAGRDEIPPAQLEIPAGRIVVGMVARLQPWKGQHHLVAALAQLRDAGHDVHGLFVGGPAFGFSPEYEPALRDLVTQLGLADRVTMVGQVASADPYLALMDVFVSASAVEPFGVSLLEAMAHGIPVVASAEGGGREIIEPGVTGLLVHAPDGDRLAGALAGLLSDVGRRRAMGAAARERCERRFDAGRMVTGLQNKLLELLDAR